MRKGGIGIFGPWTAHREVRARSGPLGKPAFAVMDMVNYRNLLILMKCSGRGAAGAGSKGQLTRRSYRCPVYASMAFICSSAQV